MVRGLGGRKGVGGWGFRREAMDEWELLLFGGKGEEI